MTELLAPAGNMEALKAAIANGCDAVYLGMQKFGARAYSSNFDIDTLREAVNYAHLRGVKIYVTMNTIVFESELEEMGAQIDAINNIGVDGMIIQDLAVLEYVTEHYPDVEAHCSTQMGVDDVEGAMFFKDLGAVRVVPAREVSIERVKEIREQTGLDVEIFVHGALCVSYSGNCLMSGLIGYRSGNRGRCVGSCRKPYELINAKTGASLGESYILSTKDLNTIDYMNALKEADSLKIEGRMKEPVYVANVTDIYRRAIDSQSTAEDRDNLTKTFNRTYTKGYMFGEDKKDITNIEKPNNYGYEIGRVTGLRKGMWEISLSRVLNQNDIIRIDHSGEDVNLSVVKLYDRDGLLVNSSEDKCYIKIKEELSIGDRVFKTKDYQYNKVLESRLEGEYRRFPVDFQVYAYPDAKLIVNGQGIGCEYTYESEEILSEAKNRPTDFEAVVKQLDRLNDTVFKLGNVDYEDCNAFIPAKMLNEARRAIVDGLYEAKLKNSNRITKPSSHESIKLPQAEHPYLTATVTTRTQYDACVKAGIENVYFDNVVRRNDNIYTDREGELLVGGYGGIYRYKDTNPFVTDYSLNVVNSKSVYQLHKAGAKRVTISYELNKKQIRDIIAGYYKDNHGYPALEMIVYGRAPLMFTKYCPLKKMDLCGECRKDSYEIRDEYGSFPILCHDDCNVTILNGKILNLLDEMPSIKGVEAFRLNFTTESPEQVTRVIRDAQAKLAGRLDKKLFNQETDTRGHYNKEIL